MDKEPGKAKAKPKKSKLDITLAKWKSKRGNLIMILHEIQGQDGFVSWEVAKEVGRRMDVPVARIYEVLTFYNYFKLERPGDYVVSVCTGTACHLKGANRLLADFSQQLGIDEGQSTPDRRFHLQSVRCLGCCGLAPVVTVNERVFGKVQEGKTRSILEASGPVTGESESATVAEPEVQA